MIEQHTDNYASDDYWPIFNKLFMYPRIYSWQDLVKYLSQPRRFHNLTIDLLRHGESVTNSQNLITGRSDVDLTALGKQQAELAASDLDSYYDFAWHSALRRSKQTLDIALECKHPVIHHTLCDARLDERSLGVLENKRHTKIDEYTKGNLRYAPENGESYAQLTQRCLSFLVDLTIITEQRRAPLKVLLSTHVGPMRIIWGIVNDIDDPVQVLAKTFRNTHVERLIMNELAWPPFLHPSDLQDMEAPNSP